MSAADADLVRIAGELSVVPPDGFTAARTAAAKAADDRALAAAIRKLRKPVLGAWVVNVFAAEKRDTLTAALHMADDLRDALESGDATALSALTRERRATLRSLTAAALEVAASHGVDVSAAARTALERTLDAALRDPDAAAAVATARLLRPIEASGMERPDLTDAVSGPYEADAAPAPPSDELAERRARRDAERAARDAARRADAADRELARAEARLLTAQEAQARLEDRLEEIETERAKIVGDLEDARQRAGDAEDARAAAQDEAQAARKQVDRSGGRGA